MRSRGLWLMVIGILGIVGAGCNALGAGDVPEPALFSLNPSSAVAGGPSFTMTVNGANFVPSSQVQWNGGNRNTTYVSATQLKAVIGIDDIANPGTADVIVVNEIPQNPNIHRSFLVTFTITPQAPFISSLSPASTGAGGAAFTLTVNGRGFVSTSAVSWNGSSRTTTFVSDTKLTAEITAADIASTGISQVTVVNPVSAGGASAVVGFTISGGNNAVPSISVISPASVAAGSGGFTLSVTGANFVAGSEVQWNGSPRVTTVLSASQLTAAILAADVASTGTGTVLVVNPAPGGGRSNAVTLDITAAPARGMIDVISRSTSGVLSDGFNGHLSLSFTGHYSAFDSEGTQLVFPSTTKTNVYLHHYCGAEANCTETTVLASANTMGTTEGSVGSSGPTSISDDGRFVGFTSGAGNFGAGTTNFNEAYVRDTCAGADQSCVVTTTLVSLTETGGEPNGSAGVMAISANGRYVAFVSQGNNIVSGVNMRGEAYLRDTCRTSQGVVPGCTPFVTLVSSDNNGTPDNQGELLFALAVSANGRFVAFESTGSNLPGSTGSGVPQIYVRDTCINVVPCTPSTTIVSVDSTDVAAIHGAPGSFSMSEDGRVIVFAGSDALAPNSGTSIRSLFLRDMCRNEAGPAANCSPSTLTVSVASDGSAANDQSTFRQNAVSATGRFVAFNSLATNLIAGGTPQFGTFVRDTCLGGPAGCQSSTVLVSIDHNFNNAFVKSSSGAATISPDGHYCGFVVFTNSGALSAQAVLALTGF